MVKSGDGGRVVAQSAFGSGSTTELQDWPGAEDASNDAKSGSGSNDANRSAERFNDFDKPISTSDFDSDEHDSSSEATCLRP
jgi:hypothetical protein